ncbi:MAG: hypothetical protein HKN79_11350 [Flavobacteriales bacterium]|nr:hypothetical protein [Flavobacteriales bacterium]
MKYPFFLTLATAILFNSCQKQELTAYEGDLFLPQKFSTTCYEEYKDHKYTQVSERDFKLLANGDLERKDAEGTTVFFKHRSSVSMLADENEGFCILWLAEDMSTNEPLTIYLFESSLLMIYDSGAAAHYRDECGPENELGSTGQNLLFQSGALSRLSLN